jgi:hypothetical protein
MSTQSSVAPSPVQLHVLGPGFGESIILFLPGYGWGVVDACSETLPTLAKLGVAHLRFIALTHPDEDHFGSLGEVVHAFKKRVDELWLYSSRGLKELAAVLVRRQERGDPEGRRFVDFLEACKEARSSGARTRYLSAVKTLLDYSLYSSKL